MPTIWFRKSKSAYYLQISRTQQLRLGKTKAEADVAYRQWLIEQGEQLSPAEAKKLSVAELAQQFLDHAKANTKPRTYEFYCYFVVPFVERFGNASAAAFPPLSFTKWLDEHTGWKGCRRNAIIAVKRLFSFGVEHKLLTESPLKGVKKPARKRRRRFLDASEQALLLGSIKDRYFREFVVALLDTGCRPSEVMNVTAAQVTKDGTKWIFDDHKTDRTGDARIVYLTPAIQELTKRLIAENPEGPLFRTWHRKDGVTRGPWTIDSVRCRFRNLRRKHPELAGVTAYVLRHTFTTDALLNGVPGPLVSSLLGHKSLKMLDEYNQIGQAADALQNAVIAATKKVS